MYLKNPYYLEALKNENKKLKARIDIGDLILTNKNIKNIKYDLAINDSEKFSIGGVYGATVTLNLLNYDGDLDNIKFENKVFSIDLRIHMEDLYTVRQVNCFSVGKINSTKIKQLSSLWVPQGIFYPTEIIKNENKTITIKLIDKTKYLDDEYVCNLTPPFTLKQLYDDVHKQIQITSNIDSFYNQDMIVEEVPEGYKAKQILGYIAECACGFYIIDRLGNGGIKQYAVESSKTIEKGVYKKFLPSENYITIQKIKYNGTMIGAQKGYVLEIDESNPFINDEIAQNILLKMQGFTYIKYTYQSVEYDFAMDVGDMFDIADRNNTKYLTYIMSNSWEYTGAITQTWSAKGENELNNSYPSKGPINQQIEKIIKEHIPTAYEKAVNKATELITKFNGGYVVKKDGELFISDNIDIDKAQHIWRWNINGLGYSSTGIDGPYGLAITMNGQIVADFITTGTMTAERIKGGILKIGGISNTNGKIEVVDKDRNNLVTIDELGITLGSGTKILGEDGLMNTYIYKNTGNVGYEYDFSSEELIKKGIFIDIPIPNNFNIAKAIIKLIHLPVYWNVTDFNTGAISYVWGYCRNLQLYKCDNINNRLIAAEFGGEVWENEDSSIYSQIEEAYGTNGFTAKVPSNNSYETETIDSIDIKEYLSEGLNRIKIETSNNIPSDRLNGTSQTAGIQAIAIIEGFIQY